MFKKGKKQKEENYKNFYIKTQNDYFIYLFCCNENNHKILNQILVFSFI